MYYVNKINIVVPCSRSTFLEQIYNSIKSTVLVNPWTIYFILDESDIHKFSMINSIRSANCEILINKNNPGFYDGGSSCRNTAIDNISSGWVMFIDDDNKMHPNLQNTLTKIEKFYPYARGFTVIQVLNDDVPRMIPHQIIEQELDTGVFIFKRDLIGTSRWSRSWVNNDVNFYKDVSRKDRHNIVHVSEIGSYYNYFKPTRRII